jgi:hypothetical protein
MKKNPRKKAASAKAETPPPILHFAKREKTHVKRVHDAIQDNLRHLLEGVQAYPADAEKCVAALLDAAVNATAMLESLYGSEAQRELVRRVALRGERFVGTYKFGLPTALRDKPRAVETRGDQMRRELTKAWRASASLRATGKTGHDWLRLSIEGFVRAVHNPAGARPMDATAKASPLLDHFLESKGMVAVPERVRARLLSAKGHKNPAEWASAFVDWYESLHPWPFKDKAGNMTWPKDETEVPGPIHREAFRRLISLQAANPDEKSPLNALRAVARERFKSAFSEVKVERDSNL